MKQYILVAGVDYEQMLTNSPGTNFKIYCINRMRRVITNNKQNDDLFFYVFDFKTGFVEYYEVIDNQLKKKETVQIYKPLLPKYYEIIPGNKKPSLRADVSEKIMSILDVYNSIQDIGINNPKTLIEVSIFSHSYYGGPILVNSNDKNPDTGLRDPNDRDARRKDFELGNISAEMLINMKKSFNDKSYFWIWGCTDMLVVRSSLHKIQQNPSYKEKGLNDETIFRLNNLIRTPKDPSKEDNEIILFEKILNKQFPNLGNVQISFGEIKRVYFTLLTLIYPTTLAKNLNLKVYAGLLGTSSTDERVAKGNKTLPNNLMMIFPIYKEIISFYQKHLSIELDPENLNYGTYKFNP